MLTIAKQVIPSGNGEDFRHLLPLGGASMFGGQSLRPRLLRLNKKDAS